MTKDQPIGVFDSGVGGLTVAEAIQHRLPHEHLLYLGDTARVPYGNRSADTIQRYAVNAAQLLIDYNVKAIVMACNTASAYGLGAVREHVAVPVIGVIEPVVSEVANRLPNGTVGQTDVGTATGPSASVVGVLATRASIQSQAYHLALQRLRPDLHILGQACPLLVPFAEEGWPHDTVLTTVILRYLEQLNQRRQELSLATELNTIILGCTHYPLLRDPIHQVAQDLFGPVTLYDSGTATAAHLEDILSQQHLLRKGQSQGTIQFLATDSPDSFKESACRIFNREFESVEHAEIRDLFSTS